MARDRKNKYKVKHGIRWCSKWQHCDIQNYSSREFKHPITNEIYVLRLWFKDSHFYISIIPCYKTLFTIEIVNLYGDHGEWLRDNPISDRRYAEIYLNELFFGRE